MQISSDFEMKKKVFSQKVFFRVFTTEIRTCREMFWGKKDFSFEKVLFFCYLFWSLCDFFVFLQIFLVRCVKPPINVLREIKWGNYPGKSVFSINFELWRKKTWFFSKTVRHDSQNSSLHVQLTIFRNFSGSKNIYMKVFGHSTETGLSKAYFKCSVQHFEKKMIKKTLHFVACLGLRVFSFDLRVKLVRGFKTTN